MGCCISKCRPKKHYAIQVYSDHSVQDKLVISQQAPKSTSKITPIVPSSLSINKISPSPPSPTTSSTSSISSFTCSNSTNTSGSSTISSCSSLSSGSSSILTSKDRSFSNEFLWSCVKENPHVIRINSIKEYSQLLVPPNVLVRKFDSSPAKQASLPLKQSSPQKVNASTPQKRVRSNSPTPVNRQKSFRRESERFTYNSLQCRTLRSQSPSRRFDGDSGRGILTSTPKESCLKRMAGNIKVNAANNNYVSSSLRRENLIKPVSPYSNHHQVRFSKETCIHRISSKIDEVAVEEALAPQDSEAVPMEDIDNPLISLDCFIFL
ncbi:uncharacterized serine-rich protein C215.13 [Ricinus communis]|uniref:uncharacterized serine-rich protein C215.13 n=1 Tax=Ricinus communis TaxID=3988 RepID=UPI00201A5160|nr:uncharacterized serine-rich protein C215.13 [Ricinus communis]